MKALFLLLLSANVAAQTINPITTGNTPGLVGSATANNCVKFSDTSGNLADAGAPCGSVTTGTSGHVVGFLDGNNTYSGTSTFTGAATDSVAGAASTPGLSVTGVPFAGTGTTSFPQLYVNVNTATASTTLNTTGTALGVNGHGAIDLINLLEDGTSQFKVGSTGTVTFPTGGIIQWNSDVSLSRQSAGRLQIGNSGAAGAAGGIDMATLFTNTISNHSTNHIWLSATAPTIASGFGTSPSVVANNGTAAFTINVGTGGTASSGVVTMPAATTGWACVVAPNGAPQAGAEMFSAPTSTTSITITNYTASTAATLAWPASAVLQVTCIGY